MDKQGMRNLDRWIQQHEPVLFTQGKPNIKEIESQLADHEIRFMELQSTCAGTSMEEISLEDAICNYLRMQLSNILNPDNCHCAS